MIFNTLAVSCVLELFEVNSITKKCALVLCESPEFYKQIVFQDNIPMIKKKSIKYPLFVFFFFFLKIIIYLTKLNYSLISIW